MKKIFKIWTALIGLLLIMGAMFSCRDNENDKGGDGNDVQLITTTAEALYDKTEAPYAGAATLKGQYVSNGEYTDCPYTSAEIKDGKVSITLPNRPPDNAIFDIDDSTQSKKLAIYSFEGIGVGKSYAEATNLSLGWHEQADEGMPVGWLWIAEGKGYSSLSDLLKTENKLYMGDLITFSVEAAGDANGSTSLQLTFSANVEGLQPSDINLIGGGGMAMTSSDTLSGAATHWELGILSLAQGEIAVSVEKWGISRGRAKTTISYTPPITANGLTESERKSWMSKIPNGTKKLYQLCIPGTHDAGTFDYWHDWPPAVDRGTWQCQSSTIARQLSDGIRYLDVRVGKDGRLYHGPVALSSTLKQTIDSCIAFLKAHPSEFIFVQLTKEDSDLSASDYKYYVDEVKNANGREKYWYQGTYNANTMTIDSATRGKMLLVNSDDSGKKGFSWKEFSKQNDWDIGVFLQTPKERADMKVAAITAFNNKSDFYDATETGWILFFPFIRWYKERLTYYYNMNINCWNKQFNVVVPVRWYADYINNAMFNYVYKGSYRKYPSGIQLMDFYQQRNVDAVILSNF